MKREQMLMKLKLMMLAAVLVTGPNTLASRPNIVLIMADDLGYECLGVHGGAYAKTRNHERAHKMISEGETVEVLETTPYRTPVLDRLAGTGVRFDHCHSQPLCTPSRVQIMTGKYNSRNYRGFNLLDPDETTFAQLLKQAGYATCIAGKWQLNGGRKSNEEMLTRPRHFGFDEWCLWQVTTDGRTKIDGRRVDGRYAHPVLSINGKLHDRMQDKYGPDVCTDYLLDFMARHKDAPFLVYYPMILTHCPFTITPDCPEWQDPATRKAESNYKGNPKYFPDMVTYMDKLVGRIVDKLDQLGLRDNTLVLFTGDNGTDKPIVSTLNGRLVAGGKRTSTDWGTRVPLIANWPGTVPPGQVRDDLVDFSDFLPTLCEVAGVKVPGDLKIDGRSFLPQLTGKPGQTREWIYGWHYPFGRKDGAEWARTQRYKLYRDGRFHDVSADVVERQPIGDDALTPEMQRIREMLREAINRNTRPGFHEKN